MDGLCSSDTDQSFVMGFHRWFKGFKKWLSNGYGLFSGFKGSFIGYSWFRALCNFG
jgi:hypothetical protein